MAHKDKNKQDLRKLPVHLIEWPNLEGTISAKTARKIGIKIPEHLKGKRMRLL